jgi:hypothetical protein
VAIKNQIPGDILWKGEKENNAQTKTTKTWHLMVLRRRS